MNLKGGYLTATDAELMIKAWKVSVIEWLGVKNAFDADSDIHDYLNSEDGSWFSMNIIEVTVEVLPGYRPLFRMTQHIAAAKIISKTPEGK